jgi:hypothetical protein
VLAGDPLGRGDPVEHRHLDVEDHQVGPQLGGQRDGLLAVLGLADDVRVNPSGGALASNPMFSAGGIRVGEAAKQIWSGSASKTLAHATSGPALQQNLVCVLGSDGPSERQSDA